MVFNVIPGGLVFYFLLIVVVLTIYLSSVIKNKNKNKHILEIREKRGIAKFLFIRLQSLSL